jgi:hypothetical protein
MVKYPFILNPLAMLKSELWTICPHTGENNPVYPGNNGFCPELEHHN